MMKKYSLYIALCFFIIAFITIVSFIPIGVSKLIPQVEKQIADELGVDAHIEKLILRGGPFLKIKSPMVYLMYNDGQKFGQINNIKFYIPWTSLFHHKSSVYKICANTLVLNINSDDKQIAEILSKIDKNEFKNKPDLYIKEYTFLYKDKQEDIQYRLDGTGFSLTKMQNFQNWKIKTDSNLYINDKKFLNMSVDIKNKYDISDSEIKFDVKQLVSLIKSLDFYSDIISDLTIYKNSENVFQASGFINIDNISILDKDKKCPKSFIYATLWGNKASILSNIYTDENKKIYLEGKVNNSKKTNIDLRVKSDAIELGDLYKKLEVLSFFTCLRDITNLSGKLEANFTLKGDLSKIKSNGYLKISDANFYAKGILIEKINSDIDLSNNKINIRNAVGMVKQSPITAKGSIDNDINLELKMDKVPLKHLCPENIGIKDGIISLVTTLKGDVNNIIHKEKIQIDNLKIVNNNHDLSVVSLTIDTNKNNTAYITDFLYQNPYTEIIKIPSLRPTIEKEDINIPFTKVFMPNSQFELQGKIENYYNKNISFNTKLNGNLHAKDLKSLNNISDTYPVLLNINGNRTVQNVVAQVLLEKASVFSTPSLLSATIKKENKDIKAEEIAVIDYNGKFSDDYKINTKGNKKLILNGLIENIDNPVLKNVRLFVPQPITVNIYDIVAQLKGDIFINGNINQPDVVGQLSLMNLYNNTTHTTITNSVLDFNKNLIVFNMPSVKISDFTVSLTGTALTKNIFKELTVKQLNIKSKYINTDTFLMYKDFMFIKKYPVTISDAKFYTEKLQTTIYASPIYLSAVSGDFKLKDDNVSVKNLSAEAYNGKINGTINYNLREDIYSTNIMARAISAAPIFSMISDKDDTISGVMDLDAVLNGALSSKNNVNGSLKFIVHNGRMSTLGRLEHLLYAQNVIADNMLRTSLGTITRAITLKDTGLFKYLKGVVSVKNSTAEIHYIQSQGPLMALLIKGQYDINSDTARLTILGRLSDEVTNCLGAFGEFSFDKLKIMLTGEDNKYKIKIADIEMLPQLTSRNTKEFYSLINGNIRKSNSVVLFNWISYTERSLRQKEVPISNIGVPSFIDELPY